MSNWILKENERLDDLIRDGMKIIQRTDGFCFSIDSVLLAHYVSIKNKDKIADLGTGTGIIPLLLSALGAKDIAAFEINPIMADIAKRNVSGNKKNDIIKVLECDYKKIKEYYPTGSFTSVVANPPYRDTKTGKISNKEAVATACYEINATIEDVFKTAQYLLKYGGRLTMVHRADRLCDLITYGRKYKMEAKRMRFIYARKKHNAVRVLVEWKYGGNVEVTVEPPLFLHYDDGAYTEEVLSIYGKE